MIRTLNIYKCRLQGLDQNRTGPHPVEFHVKKKKTEMKYVFIIIFNGGGCFCRMQPGLRHDVSLTHPNGHEGACTTARQAVNVKKTQKNHALFDFQSK